MGKLLIISIVSIILQTYPFYVSLADELLPFAHSAKIGGYPDATSLTRRIRL